MNDLIKYDPQIEIITFGGDKFYTSATNKQAIIKSLNSDRFIEVEGSVINSRDIRLIKQVSLKFDISRVPVEFREQIKARFKIYKESILKEPTDDIILKWINKLKNGESI